MLGMVCVGQDILWLLLGSCLVSKACDVGHGECGAG